MKTERPEIAVLITCHNRKEKTLRCLRTLSTTDGNGERFLPSVFLVDDKCTDGTPEEVARQFPEVKIIPGNGKLYWNRGMYLAWSTAAATKDYDFYLWLNDDITLFPGSIAGMLDCYQSAKSESVICGSTYSEFSKKYTYGGSALSGADLIPNGTAQECYTMNGNCVLISREVFKKVGFVDNIFPHAMGDYDYGFRVQKKGFKVLVPGEYVAFCEPHDRLPDWCRRDVPLFKRLKSLYSPLGYGHPYYYFIFEKRHAGLFLAIKHYFSSHLRAFIPSLWKLKG